MPATLEATPKTRANVQIALALGILVIAELLMFQGIEPFSSWFYPLVWWSYIFLVDGLVYRLQGNSLINSRTREFAVMIPWSVAVWLLFEMINLRVENWYYANVIDNRILRWPGYFISYATVLPGIFETAELFCCLGLFAKVKTNVRIFPSLSFPVFYTAGAVCILLPLLFPRFCFPLIWVGFIFLLDPLNYIHGSPSLLREWEHGRPRTLLLLLTAGFVCGGLWEFWNFWCHSKWIYTVPFFDELKIFEMPVAGFFGFPPFAVQCYVMYNFIALFRSCRTWARHQSRSSTGGKMPKSAVVLITIAACAYYAIAFWCIDRFTVGSYASLLAKMPSLTTEDIARFHQRGIRSVAQLLDACDEASDREDLQKYLGWDGKQLQALIDRAQLAKLKWMGIHNALLLQKAGISSIKELARQNPQALYTLLAQSNTANRKTPSKKVLRIWVHAAQKWTEKRTGQ